MKVRILRPALEDLAAGQRFYAKHGRQVGLHFLTHLFAEIDILEHQAGIHPVRFGFHRMLSRRFPFAVYYRVNAGEAVVFRVLDCRRDPNWIRRSLRGS